MRRTFGTLFGTICCLLLASPAFAAPIFSDNFNMGDNRDVVGNGWQEYDPSVLPDPTAPPEVNIIDNTLRIRSGTNSGALDAEAYHSVSTLGFTNIVLSFTYKTGGSETPDKLIVDWRTGSGAWTTTADDGSMTFPLDGVTAFTLVNFNLGPLAANQANLEFRFYIDVDALNPVPRPPGPDIEGARIDDVALTGDAIAVPEPATLALFGTALLGGLGMRWRRAKARRIAARSRLS
jgi:hypothetical protein